MTNKTLRSLVGAVAAAASFALAPTAQAALYYQSDFDPVDFSVKAIFEVGESCLPSGTTGWVAANGFPLGLPTSPACTVSLYSAVATITDGATAHVQFVSTPISDIIAAIYDNDGEPAGIEWLPNLLGPETTSSPAGTWTISFANFSNPFGEPPFDSTALLFERVCVTFRGREHCGWHYEASAAVVTGEHYPDSSEFGFRPLGSIPPTILEDGTGVPGVAALVPEPSSIALLLGALGAGWLTRRRKAVA